MITGVKSPLDIYLELFSLDKEKLYDVQIVEHKGKRSLNANGYYWKLICQIADKMRMSKEEVHRKMLKEYGKVDQFKCSSNVAIEKYFKYCEKEVGNKDYTIYKVYQPSSTMNTYDFSKLLDGVVQEAISLEIPVMKNQEVELLLKERDEEISLYESNK